MIPLIGVVLLMTIVAAIAEPQQDELLGNNNDEAAIELVFGPDPASDNSNNNNQNNPSKTSVVRDTPEDSSNCTCVPYYLCKNNTINRDGAGYLDLRVKPGSCKDYIDTCCSESLDPKEAVESVPTKRRGCGQRHPDGIGFRITGGAGNEAEFGEFPWMVGLLKKSTIDTESELAAYICGGALIHERVVLTAAHCVIGRNERTQLLARVGEWDTQRTNEIYPHKDVRVTKVLVHSDFKVKGLYNNFALLLLEAPVTLGENVDTVCLPTSGVVPLSRECYATGWGKDKFGENGTYAVILKKIDLPIVPRDQCVSLLRKTRLGPSFNLHESFICAGGIPGKDTCTGDGGSPLVCPIEGKPGTYEVTGLVAWGIGCGNENPGVYTGVAYARKWIDQRLAGQGIILE